MQATAGLRLLPGDTAEQILREVCVSRVVVHGMLTQVSLQVATLIMNDYPFWLPPHSVGIMDGDDEGAF